MALTKSEKRVKWVSDTQVRKALNDLKFLSTGCYNTSVDVYCMLISSTAEDLDHALFVYLNLTGQFIQLYTVQKS